MALKFAQAAGGANQFNMGAPATTERHKTQVWLNVGTTVQTPNAETGEVEDVFVAPPIGIPLDTMENMEVRGTNKNWANMVQAKNWLLGQLKALGEGVEAGDEEIIGGLQIQVKRVGSAQAPSADENPFLSAMRGRLSVVK